MLGVGVLEHTFGTKHLLIALTEELNLLVFMGVAVLNASILGGTRCSGARTRVHLSYRQRREHGIVHWQVICTRVMCDLVEGALDD